MHTSNVNLSARREAEWRYIIVHPVWLVFFFEKKKGKKSVHKIWHKSVFFFSFFLTDLVENWLNNDMIGETGMVENFDVSLCLSFIRKKRQQERECGFYIQSRRCNVLRLKCEWMWDWCHGSCGWCRRCVNSVGGVYRRLRNAWIVWECVQETKKSQRVTKMALQTNLKVQHQFQRPCWSMSKGCLRWRGALSRHAPSGDVGRPPLVWRWAHWRGQNVLP